MILDSYIVFSGELRLTSQSTIWLQESCHFAFEAALYVCLVYYEDNPEILKMQARLGGYQLSKIHIKMLVILLVGIVFVFELSWNCYFGWVYCIGIGIGFKRLVLFKCESIPWRIQIWLAEYFSFFLYYSLANNSYNRTRLSKTLLHLSNLPTPGATQELLKRGPQPSAPSHIVVIIASIVEGHTCPESPDKHRFSQVRQAVVHSHYCTLHRYPWVGGLCCLVCVRVKW